MRREREGPEAAEVEGGRGYRRNGLLGPRAAILRRLRSPVRAPAHSPGRAEAALLRALPPSCVGTAAPATRTPEEATLAGGRSRGAPRELPQGGAGHARHRKGARAGRGDPGSGAGALAQSFNAFFASAISSVVGLRPLIAS